MIDYYSDVITSKKIRIEVAKRLHHERLKAKLSLEQLAEQTGYSKPTVQRWEKGWKEGTGDNIIPTLDQIIELCAIYRCSPGYLLCEYDTRTRQAFDAELNLGLTEDSIKAFQEDVIYQLNTRCPDPCTVFMCFLNYFLTHMSTLRHVISERYYHEHWEQLASKQPGIEIAREALQSPEIQHILLHIRDFYDKDERTLHFIDELKNSLKKYYMKHCPPHLTPEYLVERTVKYCEYLHPYAIRQNDFSLSTTFLDIIRGFFSNFENEKAAYNQFVSMQQQKLEKNNPGYRDTRKPNL